MDRVTPTQIIPGLRQYKQDPASPNSKRPWLSLLNSTLFHWTVHCSLRKRLKYPCNSWCGSGSVWAPFLMQVVEEVCHCSYQSCGGGRLGFFSESNLWSRACLCLGEWHGHQPPFLLQGKSWMLQRVREFLSSYHQLHGVEGGTDNHLSCNFCFGKSCQGSTALKPPPRPF